MELLVGVVCFVVVVGCFEVVLTVVFLFAVLSKAITILFMLLVRLLIAEITLFEVLRKLVLYSDKTGFVPLFHISFIVDDI